MKHFRFTSDFIRDGFRVKAGVAIRGEFLETSDCVSLVGSESFKNIPLEILEEFEPVKYVVKKRAKKEKAARTEAKTANENARCSSKTALEDD